MQFSNEQQEYIDKWYLALPVDADGVPIRPGDEMQMALGETAEVVAVGSDRWFFDQSCLADDGEEYDWEWAHSSRHFKLDTVEILLEELVLNHEWGYLGMVCNKDEMDEVIADYAERIRKVVEDE